MAFALHIQTGCRLHFGPLAVGATNGRSFGGIGLMLEEPGLEVRAVSADRDELHGPDNVPNCIAAVLSRVRSAAGGLAAPALQLEVARMIPRHAGLGSGTQFALAVAQAAVGPTIVPASQLAKWTGRGMRSAVGVHGFEHGGFLVDAGKRSSDQLGTLAARTVFPPEWRVLLWAPGGSGGLAGDDERVAFARLAPMPVASTDRLCALVVRELLPAIHDRDWEAFSAGLGAYGNLVGAYFAPVQGGLWSHPRAAEVVLWLARQGIDGVAQSSWGPALAAVLPNQSSAEALVDRGPFEPDEVAIVNARNRGADIVPDRILGSSPPAVPPPEPDR